MALGTPVLQAIDAAWKSCRGDRGQIITLDKSTSLSGQTLANLFNNGNSVVARNFETTILNRLSNLR
ncbi:MAG: hypothetical protein HC856_01845 [Pseudanabaena sp. RU_4_16]|nr:hypothetical protein [Pseudanabaena sp. RU_4_16]